MSQDALFQRGETAEHREVDSAPAVEHSRLPQAAQRDKTPTLTLSCESEEARTELAALLAVRVSGRTAIWEARWPERDDELTLDLDT